MVSLLVVFFMFVVLFGIIGGIRGWAKELLVIFSVMVALAFISVIENLVPTLGKLIKSNPGTQFYLRIGIVIILAFFGYQTPKLSRLARAAERREAIPEMLLGVVFGFLSGYFIIGSLWYFMHQADYPFAPFITRPKETETMGKEALWWLGTFAPVWFNNPTNAFISVVISLIFVIVVFL